MGLLASLEDLNPFASNQETDNDRGLVILTSFHNWATIKYPQNYSLSSVAMLQAQYPTGFAGVIGNIASVNDISDSDLKSAGQGVADQTQGMLPPDTTIWIQQMNVANTSLIHRGLDFVSSIPSTVAVDVSSAASAAGSDIKAGYTDVVSGTKTVLGDAASIVTTPIKGIVSGLSMPLIFLVGGLLVVVVVVAKTGILKQAKVIPV